MADPVSSKSSFLCMYMSNHPDTLVAYVKYYGKVKEGVSSAKMVRISTTEMTLEYTSKGTASTTRSVTIPLSPPLKDYNDVKPRLLEMKSVAQENLGMIKTPQITSFRLPFEIWQSTLVVGFLVYFAIGSRRGEGMFRYAKDLYEAYPYAGKVIDFLAILIGIVHVLETGYIITVCRKHTSFSTGVMYTLAVMMFGVPVLKDVRKRVQDARIDSVMKVE